MYKSYKICNYCNSPIHRNGVIVYKRQGEGYQKEGNYYHRGCIRKINKMEVIEVEK